MNNKNTCVECNVCKCRHNYSGKRCSLESIKITCNEKGCTRCGDYDEE